MAEMTGDPRLDQFLKKGLILSGLLLVFFTLYHWFRRRSGPKKSSR